MNLLNNGGRPLNLKPSRLWRDKIINIITFGTSFVNFNSRTKKINMRKLILCFSLLSFLSAFNALAIGEDSTKKNGSLPSILVKDMNGQPVNFAEFITPGQITVVSFWATWCKPCIVE